MNLASILSCHAKSRPEKPAIEFRDEVISFSELWQKINHYAGVLLEQGIQPGDRVGLCLKEHPGHLILHYTLARIGAVILPIDHRWTGTEKYDAASNFSARLVIQEKDDEMIEGIDMIRFPFEHEGQVKNNLPAMPESEHMPLLVSLSSGTTGKPRGAIVTHDQMYERFVSQWVTMGFNSEDRFVSLTPLFFGAGRSFCMCFLAAGATVIIDPPPHKPEDLVDIINKTKASITFLVPTLLRRLLPLAVDKKLLLPDLQRLLISGATLYPEEAQAIQDRINPNLTGYYASSEGGGISVLNSSEYSDHADTVGRPTFRTEVEIVDDRDQIMVIGETGRLRYRGPAVAGQFIDSDGHNEPFNEQGWFYPGDMAAILRSGHIVLRGRDKDMINRGGVNIYPAEIEAVIMKYPAVSEVAVIGQASESLGEEVIACLVSHTALSSDVIQEHCTHYLAPYKIPSHFHFLDTLPKKTSGKIDKSKLSKLRNL